MSDEQQPDLEFESDAEDTAEETVAVATKASARTVRITQMDLNGLAYGAGAVDGILGPRTRQAIKEWQFNWQLAVTGRLNSRTYHSLVAHVRVIQVAAGGIEADGIYGPATTEAVKRFQRHHHLHADGIAGPATHAAMGVKYQGP